MGKLGKVMRNEIASRLAALRQNQFEVIQDMPKSSSENIANKLTVTQWIDRISDSEFWVVVQAYRSYILGIGVMKADGFKIFKDGTIVELTEKELGPFS